MTSSAETSSAVHVNPAEVKLLDASPEEEWVLASLGKFEGAKHKSVRAAFNTAKRAALDRLRREAVTLGANAVSDVSFKKGMEKEEGVKASATVKTKGNALTLQASQ